MTVPSLYNLNDPQSTTVQTTVMCLQCVYTWSLNPDNRVFLLLFSHFQRGLVPYNFLEPLDITGAPKVEQVIVLCLKNTSKAPKYSVFSF